MASLGNLTGSAKLNAVTNLLDKLSDDLESAKLSVQQRDAALEELKLYGRDPRNSDPIFSKKGIETLTRHAFNKPSSSTSRNALRVLCNALLLEPETRQMFVDLGYEAQACSLLQNDNRDDEFLVSRLIFLTTYETNINLAKLVGEYHLADAIVENLSRHTKRRASDTESKAKVEPMEDMALAETLKLLVNLTRFCPGQLDHFAPAIPHIVALLRHLDIPAAPRPLDPPIGSLLNALMTLLLDTKDGHAPLFPSEEPLSVTEKLVTLLDLSMNSYSGSELEHTVTPLACILWSMYGDAPEAAREFLRGKLLPTEQDRQTVLGKSDTLPSRLLQNSTNPLAPEFRKAISNLYYDMSDKDASTFVTNVGYGFASGFLFQNQQPVPDSARTTQSITGPSGGRAVNPITGQFLDQEKFSELPEMTDEEKEREAERLFVLFERLKKTGIISVQNPVEQAMQSGRFEELDDDYDEGGSKDRD